MAERLIDNQELYTQYNWFQNNYPPAIQKASDEFFMPGFSYVLLGISKNVNPLMDKDAYFVTKIRIDKQHDMFFRMSEKAISIILDRALGKSNKRFNLNKITDLEAKVITAFNDFMFGMTSQFLSPPPPTLKRTNFDVVHLTFLVKDNDTAQTSKFIVSLPEVLLNPETVIATEDKFDYGDFVTSTIDVSIKVGTSRTRLYDVKNIEKDDIVILDNSNSSHMVLKFGDYEEDINLNPNLGLVLSVEDEDGGDNNMADTNLWDSIEVEMGAQFDTVKITLGELKKIEQGLVVDLTSIYNNKVTLTVEDKPIAHGELVIVNDRYGVKIEEVIANTSQNIEQEVSEEIPQNEAVEVDNMPQQEVANNQVEGEAPANEEDEFDYSDFELDDEDI